MRPAVLAARISGKVTQPLRAAEPQGGIEFANQGPWRAPMDNAVLKKAITKPLRRIYQDDRWNRLTTEPKPRRVAYSR